MKRDVLSVLDLRGDIDDILSLAAKLKEQDDRNGEQLKGQTLAMLFEKSSTRTRVSFEVGMMQLGGNTLYLSQKDTQLGRGETVADTARVLSRYVQGIVYRAYRHENMVELAKHATVPVINALDDIEHPCQAMADLLTIREKKGDLEDLKLAYVGDGNNVCSSLMLACALTGMDFVAATPVEYHPNPVIAKKAVAIAKKNKATSVALTDPVKAVQGADVVYTDTWVSMGQECDAERKDKLLRPYQVNKALMSKAKRDAIFMHCLPAHRGAEVTEDVIDGEHSVVFDQAENRMHAQKAILITLMS